MFNKLHIAQSAPQPDVFQVARLDEFMAKNYEVTHTDRVEATGPVIGQVLVPVEAQLELADRQDDIAA